MFSRIGTRLAVGLITLLLMLASLALYSSVEGRIALAEGVGLASEAIVESLTASMNRVIYLKGHEVFTMMESYQIVTGVSDSNAVFDAMEDPEEYINEIDEEWISTPLDVVPEFMEAILDGNLSLLIKTQLIDHYQSEHVHLEAFGEIILTNKYGALVAATGRTTDYKQSDEAWWQTVREDKLGFSDVEDFSDVEYDESSEAYGVWAYTQVLDGAGEIIGVAKAMINVLSIAKDLELTALGYETSELKITTADGRLIFSSRAYVMLQNVSSSAFFEHIVGERGHFSEKEGHADRLFSYATSAGYNEYDGHGWLMLLSHSEDEVLGPATDLQVRILIVTALTIALGAVLSAALSRSITKPIATLETATRSMARGELDQRITVTNEGELGRLAKSFNDMAAELESLYSDLDRKVAERTEDLENVNKRLGVLASITRHDAMNQMTIQKGLLYMARESSRDPAVIEQLRKLEATTDNLVSFFRFTSEYEEVGIDKPVWANVGEAFAAAIAGLDLTSKDMNIRLEGVEIFADPMFPKVLHNLVSNSLKHGETSTSITMSYSEGPQGLTIAMEDNGVGIPSERKEAIFQRDRVLGTRTHGLFLSAEILRITKISIREVGAPGRGARFEILVPKDKYRFVRRTRGESPRATRPAETPTSRRTSPDSRVQPHSDRTENTDV